MCGTRTGRPPIPDGEADPGSWAFTRHYVLDVFYGAANSDPAVFEDPDRFDFGRTPNDHAAFEGGGAHFCLGSHLARTEIAAMFRQVLTRLSDLERAGDTERLHSVFIAGYCSMPVRFTPRERKGARESDSCAEPEAAAVLAGQRPAA